MVTRKPLPAGAQLASINSVPYPTSPVESSAPAAFHIREPQHGPAHETPDAENAWENEGLNPYDIPPSLRPGSKRSSMERPRSREDLPDSLRAGPPGYTPRSSDEMQRPQLSSTNPYLKRQQTGSADGGESSASAWGGFAERPPMPASAPPPPPPTKGKLEITRRSCNNVKLSKGNVNKTQILRQL
jgi:hypothetical protein